MKHLKFIILLLLSLLPAVAAVGKTPDQLRESFITEMVTQHGFNRTELKRVLWQARLRRPILEAISRPAEKRLTWGRYRNIFIQPRRIEGGVEYWRENEEILDRAQEKFGVPPEIIVAIIGVETLYGSHTGKFPVLDALHTLGFHYPPRSKFFRSELKHFLLLAREEELDPTRPLGSYAGAMGQPQFIPSSYRSYAVDFDGDDKRDIWHNSADTIGSVANYFARHGWERDAPVTYPLSGVSERHRHFLDAGMKPSIPVAELQNTGIRIEQTLPTSALASLIPLQGSDGEEYWLGLNNFYVITRYNHSNLYAMAVYQLSREILKLRNAKAKQAAG